MELNYNKSQLLERYYALPELVRQAISQVNMVSTIQSIGQKYQLHVDQIGQLSDEIGLVLVDLVPYDQFVQNIQRKLYLTGEQAQQIAATVNLEIFSRVQELVKELSAQALKPAPDPATTKAGFEQMAPLFESSKAAPAPLPTPKPWDNDPYIEKP